jgi:uncharacterized NAD(P)/FAD-binding protein YdhS
MSGTIVVIGGGFSGTLVAANLLRAAPGVRVILVNRSGWMARGVAYGTRTEAHVLNVPAGRMSAYAGDDEHFLRFARERDPSVTGGTFVPRRLYGEYLESVLDEAEAGAAPGTTLEHRVDHVLDVQPDGTGARVRLAGGETIVADRVVLALGNFAPAHPRVADSSFYARSPRYVRDPWRPGALDGVAADSPVLLLGTGLTMIDVLLDLRSRGHRGPVTAISRRGLMPQGHRDHTAHPTREHLPPDLAEGPATARAYLRSVRRHVRTVAAQALDWREVIGALRPLTVALWKRLPVAERRRFLRHVAVYWDVHRHRAAPELSTRLAGLVVEGQVQPQAGRVLSFAEREDGVDVTFRPRGAAEPTTLTVGAVINCTGPASDPRTLEEPLLQAMSARGLLARDPLGLGIEVGDGYAVRDAEGRDSEVLFYVGPFLKARDWEATAVPELRVHAAKLAEALASSLDSRAAADPALAPA